MATPRYGNGSKPSISGAWVLGNTGYYILYQGNMLNDPFILRAQRPAL